MKPTIKTKEEYKEIAKVLEPLGFTQEEAGHFSHKILKLKFDFSACSIEGIPYVIFNKGVLLGDQGAKERILEALGLA